VSSKKVQIPRAELAELVGLPITASDEELRQALTDAAAALDAQEAAKAVAAAEAAACAEDRRIAIRAYNDGKLPRHRIDFWVDAMKRDREGNRSVIASLAAGLFPVEKIAVDNEVDRVHNAVLGRLGIAPTPSPRTVAASGDPQADLRERAVLDAFGLPTARTPKPVVIQKGVDPSQWTEKQRQDAALRRLGQKFWPGTEKPPAGDTVYYPSPADPYRFDEATGQWVEKHPYREIP
jgi:hypothetical protein